MAKEREMEKHIEEIEKKERKLREEKIYNMRSNQRSEQEILSDILLLKNDFSEEGRKKESELFAEKRKLNLLKTL